MAAIRPPQRIKAIRRKHMDLVEEHRILNGHYKRLMMAKSVIDNSTPRSLYTNPRRKRQMEVNSQNGMGKSQSMTHLSAVSRSRSVGSLVKRVSPDVAQHNGHQTNLGISRRTDLQQGSSPAYSHRMTKASSIGHLHMQSPAFTVSSQTTRRNNPESSFSQKRRSISSKYERRHIDGDIADKHFYLFNQPDKPFHPRLLLFNLAQSKVAEQSKHYQPPFWKMRLQQMRAAKLGVSRRVSIQMGQDDTEKRITSPGSGFDIDDITGQSIDLRSPPAMAYHFGRDKILPNTLGNLSPSAAKKLLFEQPVHWREEDEWRFLKEVTQNIITGQTCSQRILFQIFSNAVKQWKNKLPLRRMRILVTHLMEDIQVPMDGVLSVYVEHEPPLSPTKQDAATATGPDGDDIEGASKYDNDEYEDDQEESGSADDILSFSDEELEIILKGKGLERLYGKLNEDGKEKNTAKKRNMRKSKMTLKDEKPETSSARTKSEKSSSITSMVCSGMSSSSGNTDNETKSSGSENGRADDGVPVELDEETVGQVSDLEEDTGPNEILRLLSISESSDSKSTSEKQEVVSAQPVSVPSQQASMENSLSSGEEFRLSAAPPVTLSSNDSASPSPRFGGNATKQNQPSRQLSLKSSSSGESQPVSVFLKDQKLQKQASEEDKRLCNENQPVVDDIADESKPKSSGISSPEPVPLEEVRQKRESFLRKLEGRESVNGRLSVSSAHWPAEKESNENGTREDHAKKIEDDVPVEETKESAASHEDSHSVTVEDNSQLDSSHPESQPHSPNIVHNDNIVETLNPKLSQEFHSTQNSSVVPDTRVNGEDTTATLSRQSSSSVHPPKPKPRNSISRSSFGSISVAGGIQQRRTMSKSTSRHSSLQKEDELGADTEHSIQSAIDNNNGHGDINGGIVEDTADPVLHMHSGSRSVQVESDQDSNNNENEGL